MTLGELILQARPDLQRGKRPHAKVLASCSRRAEEPALLPRNRGYFGKNRDLYGRQKSSRIFHLRNVRLFNEYLQDARLQVASEHVRRQQTDPYATPYQQSHHAEAVATVHEAGTDLRLFEPVDDGMISISVLRHADDRQFGDGCGLHFAILWAQLRNAQPP